MSASLKPFPVVDGFPRPDWYAISEHIRLLPESTWNAEWESYAKNWLDATLASLPENYKLFESDNFFILSAENKKYVDLLHQFLERALRAILTRLDGIAVDEGFGKHVVLMFHEQETYYRYMSYFHADDGEFILSSGVFLNSGYGHFAFPFLEMNEAEATSAHELTHACLRHLEIPLWLNEGFAVTIEDEICGSQPLSMETDRLNEHQKFWTANTIQEFWNGQSFNRTDEGSSLSYELARYCLRSLAHDYEAFSAFANSASYVDGGEGAALEFYDGSLGGLIYQFFGDGDWSPKPDTWDVD